MMKKLSVRHFIVKLLSYFRDSRGITLTEVVAAMAISSVVTAGIALTMNQIFILVPKAENEMLAMRQAQSAGYWIGRDAMCAQTITPTPGEFTVSTGTPLVISTVNWDANKTIITYFVDTDQKLQRQKVVTNEMTGATVSSSQMPIAENIDSITANYDYPPGNEDKKILALTITAQFGSDSLASASATRTYNITARSALE